MTHVERLKATDLIDVQPSASERAKTRQRWPKDQRASATPHSHDLVSRAYENALIIEAMPSKLRGLMSVFGLGLLGWAVVWLYALTHVLGWTTQVISDSHSGMGLSVLYISLVVVMLLMFLITFIAAIRVFRIDLLAPKEIPLVFNRKTRKVYRYAQDIPGFEEMAGPNGKFCLRGVLRYIVSTFRLWPNMLLVEYDWDCLEAEYFTVTAMAGNVVRTDHHLDLYVRETPNSDKVIGSFALMPSAMTGEEMGRDVWEHVRRFMEENGPPLSPGDKLAPPPPKGWWQALNAPLGGAWMLFVAGIIWTWDDVYWFTLSLMKGLIDQKLWEQALVHPIPGLHKVFIIAISYFAMAWIVFAILASYLSRHAELPDDVIRECGAPVDLRALTVRQQNSDEATA